MDVGKDKAPKNGPWAAWRWGHRLSLDDARNIVEKFQHGGAKTQYEQAQERRDEIVEYLDTVGLTMEAIETMPDRYPTIGQAQEYMKEHGLTEMTVEADRKLIDREICEDNCRQIVQGKYDVMTKVATGNLREEEITVWEAEFQACVQDMCSEKVTLILPRVAA